MSTQMANKIWIIDIFLNFRLFPFPFFTFHIEESYATMIIHSFIRSYVHSFILRTIIQNVVDDVHLDFGKLC